MADQREIAWQNGYDQGRTMCLQKGAEAARQWLREHRADVDSKRFGWAAAVWDYEDANGMPHELVDAPPF